MSKFPLTSGKVVTPRDRECFERGYLQCIQDMEKFGRGQGLHTQSFILGLCAHFRRKLEWLSRPKS